MFCTYVRPILEYSSVCWSPCLVRDIVKVESVQRRFTKRIPGLHHYSYSERLRLLGLVSLEMRRLRADLIEVFKIIHGVDKLRFGEFFQLCGTNTRGHAFKLYPIKFRCNVRKHFFTNRVITVWNALSDVLVEASSIDEFKLKLLSIDLNKYLVVRDHVT